MAAAALKAKRKALQTVKAVGMELCPAIGNIANCRCKDSHVDETVWKEDARKSCDVLHCLW